MERAVAPGGTWLSQVAVVDGVERYVGTDSDRAMLGHREGRDLVFESLPFDFPRLEGRVAHFGDDPFLVVNNAGSETEATSVYVAPINRDGRASCAAGGRRTHPITEVGSAGYSVISTDMVTSVRLDAGTVISERISEGGATAVPAECPSP